MTRDINPTYRKMSLDCGPVKLKELYDELPKAMKDAYLTGNLALKKKKTIKPGLFSGRGRATSTIKKVSTARTNTNKVSTKAAKSQRIRQSMQI